LQGGGGGGGGGLTSVINKTLGAAATEFGDTIALVDGGVYEFSATCEQNGAGTSSLGWLFDSDEANTYYNDQTFLANWSDSTNSNVKNDLFWATSLGQSTADGVFVSGKMHVTVKGTALLCRMEAIRRLPNTSAARYAIGQFIYDSGTLPTQVGILSSLATGIAAGSTIKGVRLF
jgi:hypothetical protein